jgi:hypothetical protein
MTLNGDKIAQSVRFNTLTQRHHTSAGFMARDGAEWDVVSTPLIPFPDVYVRATNGRGLGLDKHFSGARRWNGMFLEAEPSNFGAGLGPRRHCRWYG